MAPEIHFGLSAAVPTTVDVSIVIVNWNSAQFVQKCLCSVYENIKSVECEVIVIDNGSNDDCGDMIKRHFPRTRFISSKKNVGFARANNLGFMHSTGRNILFLNPDTEILEQAIMRLVSFADSAPSAGVVGARLLNSDKSLQTSCIQRFPTLVNQVLDSDYLRKLAPKASIWGIQPLIEGTCEPTSVEAVSGACQLIRREVFEQVGFYESDYFMYAEDIDLCFKVQRAGFKNYYIPDAVVIHHGGKSSGTNNRSSFASVMMRESLHKFFVYRRSKLHAAAFRMITGLSALIRLVLLGGLMAITIGHFRRTTLSAAMQRWIHILRWTIGREDWVKTISPRSTCSENLA